MIRPNSNFTDFLPAALAEKYCTAFQVIGQFCPGCNGRKHVVMNRWPQADREMLIEHVERNRNNMKFRRGARFIPNDKAHLIDNGENRG